MTVGARDSQELVVGDEVGGRHDEQHRRFLLVFAQLLLVSRLHALDNAAVAEPLNGVADATAELCRSGRSLHVWVEGEQVFVNRRRVAFSMGEHRTVLAVVKLLRQRQLGGFELKRPHRPEEIKAFLAVFHDLPLGIEQPAAYLRQKLAAAGLDGIVLLDAGTVTETSGGAAVEIEESKYAALLYAKAVVLLRESLRRWEDDDARGNLTGRTRRVIQQIISLAEKTPRPFLWLLNVKDDRDYLYTHSTNTALLSILLGLRLGMDRRRLCALGMAALYHDMGRIELPSELTDKPGPLTDDERQRMQRYPVYGVHLLLRVGALNEELLQRLLVVFEHNIAVNGYPRREWPHGLHLFSRIVAMAHSYDAMTTQRSYRPAMTPDEALREIESHAGERYDADLVRVFRSVMGIYPLGTVVRLDSGELALVFHVDPERPRRPLVKLVRDPDGNTLDDGEVVDLSDVGEDGRPRRAIVATEDARSAGVHVPGYLAGIGE